MEGNDTTCARQFYVGPHRQRARGFSLIELVLVIAIIAIVSAIAVPRFGNSTDRFRVEAAAARVAADLNLARQRAKQLSQSQQIVFDVGTGTYSMPGVSDINYAAKTYSTSLAADPYKAAMAVNFGGTAVAEFDGYGRAKSGGTVTVRVGSHTRYIDLDQDSGKAVIR